MSLHASFARCRGFVEPEGSALQTVCRPTAKPLPLPVTEAAVVLVRQGRVLILERGPGGLWERFWEFPTVHLEGVNPAGRSACLAGDLREAIKRVTGITARISPPMKTISYSVTKHRVTLYVHLAKASSGEAIAGPGLVQARWVRPEKLAEYTFSSAATPADRLDQILRQNSIRSNALIPIRSGTIVPRTPMITLTNTATESPKRNPAVRKCQAGRGGILVAQVVEMAGIARAVTIAKM